MDYIKLSRNILEWEWYSDINTCRLFIHMLLKANWKEGNFRGTTVPRGSFVSSLPKLADETALTMREVRTAITHLKTTGELTCKSCSKYTIFTVKNYCLYQTSDMQSDRQTTDKRHSNDTLTTTIEEKKDENLNEDKVTFEKSDDEDLIEDATFINLREEAIKKMKENDPELKNITSLKDYEAKVNEYMQAIRDERIKNRDIKDVEFDLYKQDRTLTDEVEDTEFDKNDDKIVEYENAARMYMEKENEVFEDSLNREENIKSLLDELDDSELDFSDYEEMLRELDENLEISLEEEIETRKLA